jgi:hypothetical protein
MDYLYRRVVFFILSLITAILVLQYNKTYHLTELYMLLFTIVSAVVITVAAELFYSAITWFIRGAFPKERIITLSLVTLIMSLLLTW